MAKYFSTKCYGHNIGLSAVFRQPLAHSHCKLLHGYSLSFKFTFGCDELDERNWVVDFGGLKPLKAWLEDTFDHKVVIDVNDPRRIICYYYRLKVLQVLYNLKVWGSKSLLNMSHEKADELVKQMTDNRRPCVRVECAEHGVNSTIYEA